MNKTYRHTVLALMIASFMWVIIGDLVNMHMKIIYKKDLYSHNTFFIKTVKKDKKEYHITLKKTGVDYLSGIIKTSDYNIHPVFLVVKLNEKINSNQNRILTGITGLRAPPIV